MKKKLLDYMLILSIVFFVTPAVLYLILSSSLYNEYNLFYNKYFYIYAYYNLVFLCAILFIPVYIYKYIVKKLIKEEPIIKAELLSIEKIDAPVSKLTIMDNSDTEDIYNVQFKHKNEIIHLTVYKDDIQKDLLKGEHPYVEYKYINMIKIFNKFHNIKVHTK